MTDAAEQPAKKKRKKGKSASLRTMEAMRAAGYLCGVVERTIPHSFVKQDLFGFIDIIAIRNDIIGVQATVQTEKRRHIDKIIAEPRAKNWLSSGGRIQLWCWRKLKTKVNRREWQEEVIEITLADFNSEGSLDGVGEVRPPAEPGSLFNTGDEP